MEEQLVIFSLTGEEYGVGISVVAEVIKLQAISHVPRAPAFVEGVTNLRGKVLPVIDLRKRFGLAVGEADKETRIMVVEIEGLQVGLIVDTVSEVLRLPEGSVEPPSPVVTTVDSTFIRGIAKVGSRLIILLDLERVLRPEEKADLQQVALQGETAGPAPAETPAEQAASSPEEAPAEPASRGGGRARKRTSRKKSAPPEEAVPGAEGQ